MTAKVRKLSKLRLRYKNLAKVGLANLALVGIAGVSTRAHADTTTMITRMERDMRAMQQQIQQLKQKQDVENRRVRAQLERQRVLLESNPYAPRDRMVEGDDLSELAGINTGLNLPGTMGGNHQMNNDVLGVELSKLAKPRVGDTPFAEITSTPPAHPDLYGPLRRGQLQIGDARITLGGFLEADGLWRSSDTGSDVWTPLSAIPAQSSPYAHINEFRESSRASRLSALVEGMITKQLEADAYIEVDFGAAATSSNGRGTNAYSLRMRNAYGELKDFKHGWYVLGGQSWSLMTLSHYGMFARNEEIPLTVDQSYVAGFNYTRNAQFRLIKMFKDNLYGVGLSVESPSTVLQNGENDSGLAGGKCTGKPGDTGNVTCRNGAGINNPLTYYATDVAPDVIGKITADPKWGHFEISGVMRFFHDRARAGTPYAHNHTRIAGGGGGGLLIPLFNNKLHFRASGIVGTGVGRYGASGLPDYTTYGAGGGPQALPEASWMVGVYGRPHPRLQLYAYAGADTVLSRKYSGTKYGYGNPNYNMSGCQTQGSPALSCQAGDNIHWVGEATGGFWFTAFKGDYGSVLTGAQYAHIQVNGYSGKGGTDGRYHRGHTDADMVFFSLRYLPFS